MRTGTEDGYPCRVSNPFLGVVVTSAIAFAGCGGSVARTDATTPDDAGGAGGVIAAGGSGAGKSGASGAAGAGGAAATGGAGAGGSSGAAGVGGTGPTTDTCGPQLPCPPVGPFGSYCVYDDKLCGTGAPGHCQMKAFDCPFGFPYVCGCDGSPQSCSPGAGVDASLLGGCEAPAGMFACGYSFCKAATEYCTRTTAAVSPAHDSYACEPLPTGCTPGACACVPPPCAGGLCADGGGKITITCPLMPLSRGAPRDCRARHPGLKPG